MEKEREKYVVIMRMEPTHPNSFPLTRNQVLLWQVKSQHNEVDFFQENTNGRKKTRTPDLLVKHKIFDQLS